jgi:RNA polymerase sigma factor (sigma-70 family)
MTTAPGKAKENRTGHSSDARLIHQCLRGEESAWSSLIDKYKNLIFSIPVRYGFSQEDSADIFQAVCMDLLAHLPSLREPDALGGWLIQVTRNKCFHQSMAQRRNPVQSIDDYEPRDPRSGPEDLISEVQQEQFLREALSELSPRCRKLVDMLFFETSMRPYSDVAEALTLSVGSIGFIRRRCLNKLQRRLEQGMKREEGGG